MPACPNAGPDWTHPTGKAVPVHSFVFARRTPENHEDPPV
jgi:hypothetical protein